jgi:hypothetical protein
MIDVDAHFIPPYTFKKLNEACGILNHAWGSGNTFLVGSALDSSYFRDLDVRTVCDRKYERELINLLNVVISYYLSNRTGYPVDFQMRTSQAMVEHKGKRFALCVGLPPMVVSVTRHLTDTG